MARARELWGEIMQAGFSSQAQMWLEYIRLERSALAALFLETGYTCGVLDASF